MLVSVASTRASSGNRLSHRGGFNLAEGELKFQLADVNHIAVVKIPHIELAGCRSTLRSMRNTIDNEPDDYNGHGTHVSGIAAALTNNGRGVAGTARLTPLDSRSPGGGPAAACTARPRGAMTRTERMLNPTETG